MKRHSSLALIYVFLAICGAVGLLLRFLIGEPWIEILPGTDRWPGSGLAFNDAEGHVVGASSPVALD
jgi:hypothetical protein